MSRFNPLKSIFSFFKNKVKKQPTTYPRNRAERRAIQKAERKAEKESIKQYERQLKSREKFELEQGEKAYEKYRESNPAYIINKMLTFAKGKNAPGSDFNQYIIPIVQEVMGSGYKIKPGEDNKYFSVSSDFSGLISDPQLYKYIEFKDLPETSNIIQYMNQIEKSGYSSESKYEEMLEDRANRAVNTLLDRNGKIRLTKNLQSVLEDIMNSSAAWNIAKRNTYDSEQTKEAWFEMYDQALDVLAESGGDPKYIDEIVTMIENEESFSNIVRRMDEMLYEIMKGD